MLQFAKRYNSGSFCLCVDYEPTEESGVVISEAEKKLIENRKRKRTWENSSHADRKIRRAAERVVADEARVTFAELRDKYAPITERVTHDQDIHDIQETEDFVSGYCLMAYIPLKDNVFLDLVRILKDEKLNLFAYIPTDYVVTDKFPCGVCYLLFASEFELKLAKQRVIDATNPVAGITKKYHIETAEPKHNPVWFHKGWIRPTYVSDLYNTGAKKYNAIKDNHYIMKEFTPQQLASWRRDADMQRSCYAPLSSTDRDCRNYSKGLVNDKICYYCGASGTGKKFVNTHGKTIEDGV